MATSALGGLSDTRQKLLLLIKAARGMTVDELAESLGITKSAVRQHVNGLEAAGLLEHFAERGRAGRPRFHYALTRAAEQLFPNRYAEMFMDVLAAMDERDPGLADQMLKEHFARRTEQLPKGFAKKPVDEQVSQLVELLEEDGHMATEEKIGLDSWRLVSTNCPQLRLAERGAAVCDSELEFFRNAAPATTIECVRRIADGNGSCIHLVTAKAD